MRRRDSLMVERVNRNLEKPPFLKHGSKKEKKVAPERRRRIRRGTVERSFDRQSHQRSRKAEHLEMDPGAIRREVQISSMIPMLHGLFSFEIGEHGARDIAFSLALHELVSVIWQMLPALELTQVLICLVVVMVTRR